MIAFHSVNSFLQMGGYGNIVWPAFAIGIGLLFGNYLVTHFQFRRCKKVLEQKTKLY